VSSSAFLLPFSPFYFEMKNIFIKICMGLKLFFLVLSISLYPIAWIGYKLGWDLHKEIKDGEDFCIHWWRRISKTLNYCYMCYQQARRKIG